MINYNQNPVSQHMISKTNNYHINTQSYSSIIGLMICKQMLHCTDIKQHDYGSLLNSGNYTKASFKV